MNYDLEDLFINGEEAFQEKNSEEILKAFIRSIIDLEMDFEFSQKKEIQVMKKVHRKDLGNTNSINKPNSRKKIKKNEEEL